MCGINGFVLKQSEQAAPAVLEERLRLMNQKIIHRGPDDDGFYLHDARVAMCMRRLSIIDLANGKQPISNEDSSVTIVFNGEVYNYRELKNKLEYEGVTFKTQSDTEVVLRMYEKYGTACLQQLNGMYALSIHDKRNNTLFIARDRFGEKPLYYHTDGKEFIYASELKSIVAVKPEVKIISNQSLAMYFALTYIPAPFTIYDGVFKLKPAHYLLVDTQTLGVSEHKYWDVSVSSHSADALTYEEAKLEVRNLLIDSVEKRMISDVPLGVFLSGGVDSSIVSAIMSKITTKRIKTFSVGYYNPRYDESDRAKKIAAHIGSEHYSFMLNYSEILDVLDQIILNYDEPFADSSCLPTYFVSLKTRKEVTVALTGDGGDEVFGGYNKYLLHTYGKWYSKLVPKGLRDELFKPLLNSSLFRSTDTKSRMGKVQKFVNALGEDTVTNHLNIITLGFRKDQLDVLLNDNSYTNYQQQIRDHIDLPEDSISDMLKVARYIDKQTSLEGDMLAKVDRASMLVSLECRAPFLDHRLFELTYKMPDQFLIDGNNKKRILKDTFADLVPKNFFTAPKSGFEVPIAHWLRNELKQELLETLSYKNLSQHGLLNIDYVNSLIEDHLLFSIDRSFKLWTIFCFQKWYNSQLNS